MEDKKHIVISLGGSLIVPGDIDTDFLNAFKNLIESYIQVGFSFIIITGGGTTARMYQQALVRSGVSSLVDLDLIGIEALRLNAFLLLKIFGENAHHEVINSGPDGLVNIKKPIVICGAHKPGSSTDLGAINFAIKVGAKKVINLSNIDYVYDKDPRTNQDAKRFELISWSEYRSYIPKEWKPGLSTPFDPIASEKAEEANIEVAVLNGKNLENLKNYLEELPFTGTRIS